MKKVTIKQNGSIIPSKIIQYLELLGGKNSMHLIGNNINSYYYIDIDSTISCMNRYPSGGYREIFIDSNYPKRMYVSCISKEDAIQSKRKRNVVHEFIYDGKLRYVANDFDAEKLFVWDYVAKISSSPIVELTLSDIANFMKIDVTQLRIKE